MTLDSGADLKRANGSRPGQQALVCLAPGWNGQKRAGIDVSESQRQSVTHELFTDMAHSDWPGRLG